MKRRPDDFPIERKLGYDHAVEMAAIEKRLRAEGVTGVALHFEAVRRYEVAHRNDPTFKDRQKKWLATCAANTRPDLFRLALVEIRDGHNDPRGLARRVLEEAA
jgi:hypothetical protein